MIEDINKLQTSRVLVLGDVILDRYWQGDTTRISPEAPVPVVKVVGNDHRLGGAGNVALNIASLGASTTLLAACGNDDAGKILLNLLSDSGIANQLLTLQGKPTITKLRVVSREQQLLRIDFEETFNDADLSALQASLATHLPASDVLVLSDYAKGTLKDTQQYIRQAQAQGVKVLVDPKATCFKKYQGADIITPNYKEFTGVVGTCEDHNVLVSKAVALARDCQFGAVLVTQGKEGMTLIESCGKSSHFSANAREVYDVTGAGDTVIAVLATAIGAGLSGAEAARLANDAAGLVVAKFGTATITPCELLSRYANDIEHSKGVVSQKAFLSLRQRLKSQKKRLVMTNGCFDILHQGHVDYLQKARDQGDFLVVAVNSDASVKRLKGTHRPINPLSERMAVLAGLSAVDWVIPFEEDTPQRLIAGILPDILAKGNDYTVEQIAGHREVLDSGGEVILVPLVEGCATSNVVQRILESAACEV